MIDAGIHSGDILIVDKSIDALPNNIVIAVSGGNSGGNKRYKNKKGHA